MIDRRHIFESEQRLLNEIKKASESEYFLDALSKIFDAEKVRTFEEFCNVSINKDIDSCKNELFMLRLKIEVMNSIEEGLKRKITDGIVARSDLKEIKEVFNG